MLTIIFALIGYNVDVVCYSSYLSSRDYEDFRILIETLGIKDSIQYGTFTEISDKLINKEGDLRQMSQQLLRGEKFKKPPQSK